MRLGTAQDFWELVWALVKAALGIVTGLAAGAVITVVGIFVYEYLTH